MACSLLSLMAGTTAQSDVVRLTMKSVKASTPCYAMMVQLSEVIKVRSEGAVQPTVEESQDSIQNVKEALARSGNFLFTSPPMLIDDARNRRGAFLAYEGSGFFRIIRHHFRCSLRQYCFHRDGDHIGHEADVLPTITDCSG